MKFSFLGIFTIFNLFVNSYSLLPKIKINYQNKNINIRKIDKKIVDLTAPATLNYIMTPVVSLVDSYWISQLGGAKQLAGQGCADQMFNLAYSFTSFMPLVLTPIIADYSNRDEKKGIIEQMNCAIFISSILGILIGMTMSLFSEKIITFFVPTTSNIYIFAVQYLRYRSIAFPFVLINSVIFSVFRGMMDFNSALIVNVKSQVFNLVADPILMKICGIKGVAIASTLSDILCTVNYYFLLKKKNLIKIKLFNLFGNVKKMLRDGIFIQMKSISYNIIYFLINKKILSFDQTGKISAANIISCKIIELLSILYESLRSVSTILIPNSIFNKINILETSNRLIYFGVIISIIQSLILFFGKSCLKYFTSDQIVINECLKILPYIILFASLSGISTIMDGILQGKQHYKLQTYNSILILLTMFIILPNSKTLEHVWLGTTLFSLLRLPFNYILMRIIIRD